MPKIIVSFKSTFVTKEPRQDREPTVFKRTILKLIEDKMHPGKIHFIYTKFDDDYKIFGAFSFNTGGSISFFPDFHNLDNFDHLTLAKDFIKNNGHLTKVRSDGKHKKLLHFQANKLPTGDYHIITFVFKGTDLLMDSLPEIFLPELEYEKENEKDFLNLIQDSLHNDRIILTFPSTKGHYCVQLLAIPKGRDLKNVSIALGFESIFKLDKPIGIIQEAYYTEIKTPYESDFKLCIICFTVDMDSNAPFGFSMAQNPQKPPNKNLL